MQVGILALFFIAFSLGVLKSIPLKDIKETVSRCETLASMILVISFSRKEHFICRKKAISKEKRGKCLCRKQLEIKPILRQTDSVE